MKRACHKYQPRIRRVITCFKRDSTPFFKSFFFCFSSTTWRIMFGIILNSPILMRTNSHLLNLHPLLPSQCFEVYGTFRRTKAGRAPGRDNLPMGTLLLLRHPLKRIPFPHYSLQWLFLPGHLPPTSGNPTKSLWPMSLFQLSPLFTGQLHLENLRLHDTPEILTFHRSFPQPQQQGFRQNRYLSTSNC